MGLQMLLNMVAERGFSPRECRGKWSFTPHRGLGARCAGEPRPRDSREIWWEFRRAPGPRRFLRQRELHRDIRVRRSLRLGDLGMQEWGEVVPGEVRRGLKISRHLGEYSGLEEGDLKEDREEEYPTVDSEDDSNDETKILQATQTRDSRSGILSAPCIRWPSNLRVGAFTTRYG